MNVVYSLCDSLINDAFDRDVMKFEMIAQLFNNGRLAASWWSGDQYSHWLHTTTASMLPQ